MFSMLCLREETEQLLKADVLQAKNIKKAISSFTTIFLSAKHPTPCIFRACTSLNLTQILRLLSLSNFTQQSHKIHCLHIFFYKTWTFKHSVLCNFSFNNFFCISNRCISKRGLLRGVFFLILSIMICLSYNEEIKYMFF